MTKNKKSNEKFTVNKVIKAITGTGGIKTQIAKNLGCHRFTVDNYIEKYATIKRAYEEERNRVGDMVEAKIIEKCNEGDCGMLRFYARTKLSDRGYVERQEISGVGGKPIPHTIKVIRATRDGDDEFPEDQ